MSNKIAIALLVLLAIVPRAWDFPHRHEMRDSDEIGYVNGSLHVLEGMIPSYKFAPAGPQVWAGWLYGGARAAWYLARPTAEERAVDARVRPFVATNHAIWDAYADMAVIRAIWVLVTLPVVLWALVEAFKLGVHATGSPPQRFEERGAAAAAAAEPSPPPTSTGQPPLDDPPIGDPPIDGPPIAVAPPPPPPATSSAAAPVEPPAVTPASRVARNAVGTAAGFLVAGTVALTPMYIDLGNQARPYVMAWAFGIIALSLAVRRHDARGRILSAVTMGLAIASRIDMLVLLPVVWSEQFARRRQHGLLRPFVGYLVVAAITTLLFAPWLLTNLIGNLRIIATVRLSAVRTVTYIETLRDLAWTEGLWLLPLLALAGIVWPRRGERVPRVLLAGYVVLVGLSIFKSTAYGLRHQGGPIVILIVMSAFALRPLMRSERGGAIAWGVVLAALLLPAVQSVRGIAARQRGYVDDTAAVAWIERHVAPGTRLYTSQHIYNPLPTRQASDALWAEVNDGNAWEKKFRAGLSRFNVSADEIPRALSEENMLVEKGNRRGWFILGSRGGVGRPRYDIRHIAGSPIFGVHDLPGEFAKTGGVVLWRGALDDPEVKGFPPPAQHWDAPSGKYGVFVFASPDVTLRAGATTTAATSKIAPAAAAATVPSPATTVKAATSPAAATTTTRPSPS